MAVTIDGTSGVTSPLYNVANCIYQNAQTIGASYTIPASTNAMSSGPITIGTGFVVTVTTGSRWVIV
jgi:hypothetical protein